MEERTYILVEDFCNHHRLEINFIQKLEERGVIAIRHREAGDTLPMDTIKSLERMVRLHQDLGIHPDDLDVVSDLLDKINDLEEEVNRMKAQLRFFEAFESR